jgi:predicted nuclease of restriction endonuclease-like (RecB) superfamily
LSWSHYCLLLSIANASARSFYEIEAASHDKNDAVVRMTLPEGEKRIVAARYEVLLPSAEELEAVVQEGRRAAERRT